MDNPILKYMQEAFNSASPEITENDKIPDEFKERDLAAVGYIGPVFLYSLIKNSGSELVKYHAGQSAGSFKLNVAERQCFCLFRHCGQLAGELIYKLEHAFGFETELGRRDNRAFIGRQSADVLRAFIFICNEFHIKLPPLSKK